MNEIANIMGEFEQYLIENKPKIQSFHNDYEFAVWEMMLNGGKRFRPGLLLCVVEALAPQMLKNAFNIALAIECIHTYSLIHDDLPCMDNAPLRRGHKTLHTKYDETLALLVGDGLNTYAFALLAQSKLDAKINLEIIKDLALNAGIGGMVLGQVLDCAFEKQKLDIDKLIFIHTNKTAKLIATSLKCGVLIANQEVELANRIYDFGIRLGVYFQQRKLSVTINALFLPITFPSSSSATGRQPFFI